MLPKRLRVSKPSADTLKMLKARTGVTPNILCRLALVRSMEEGKAGGLKKVDQSGNEFNAPTLFGEYGLLFETLLRQLHGPLEGAAVAQVIASHIDEGLKTLRKAKNLQELMDHSGFEVSKMPSQSDVRASGVKHAHSIVSK
jgi:DNA sulfur modification protein DndE